MPLKSALLSQMGFQFEIRWERRISNWRARAKVLNNEINATIFELGRIVVKCEFISEIDLKLNLI